MRFDKTFTTPRGHKIRVRSSYYPYALILDGEKSAQCLQKVPFLLRKGRPSVWDDGVSKIYLYDLRTGKIVL